jgi:hypothetical protein
LLFGQRFSVIIRSLLRLIPINKIIKRYLILCKGVSRPKIDVMAAMVGMLMANPVNNISVAIQ